jgi:hypothetical protein
MSDPSVYSQTSTTVYCACCSSTQEDSSPSACLRGLARHFKTEPTETLALCFGYPKHRAVELKASCQQASVDEQHNCQGLGTVLDGLGANFGKIILKMI